MVNGCNGDIVLFSDYAVGMEKMTNNKLSRESVNVGLRINREKMNIMFKKALDEEVKIGGN